MRWKLCLTAIPISTVISRQDLLKSPTAGRKWWDSHVKTSHTSRNKLVTLKEGTWKPSQWQEISSLLYSRVGRRCSYAGSLLRKRSAQVGEDMASRHLDIELKIRSSILDVCHNSHHDMGNHLTECFQKTDNPCSSLAAWLRLRLAVG